eukprot:233852-Alexandrium_andersonii.AAC.1
MSYGGPNAVFWKLGGPQNAERCVLTVQNALLWKLEFPERRPTKKKTSCCGGAFHADGAREGGENE